MWYQVPVGLLGAHISYLMLVMTNGYQVFLLLTIGSMCQMNNKAGKCTSHDYDFGLWMSLFALLMIQYLSESEQAMPAIAGIYMHW